MSAQIAIPGAQVAIALQAVHGTACA
jgi:hypothetical protein